MARTPSSSDETSTSLPRFGNLPLFWKLLLPFLALILVIGALGTFFIVRDLTERANLALGQEMQGRALEARSGLRDQELYVVESANFASNLQGMAAAIDAQDSVAVGRLLSSVIALKPDLDLAVVTDAAGKNLTTSLRNANGSRTAGPARDWSSYDFVGTALRDRGGQKSWGFVRLAGREFLAIVAPICRSSPTCDPAGAAIAGADLTSVAQRLAAAGRGAAGIALFDTHAQLLASAGTISRTAPSSPGLAISGRGSKRVATLPISFRVADKPAGTIALSVPAQPAFASAQGTGLRLALVALATMAGIVAIGTLLSRFILRQVRPLVATSRALGRGDLSARADVLGDDELGELALRVNEMADQLQASVETLELRVGQRTEEIRRLLKERDELFAAISHQLRTPIAVIMRQADLMDDATYRRSKAFSRTSDYIRISAQQLETLVNNVLNLASAEAGAMPMTLEPVTLADVLAEVWPTIAGLSAGGGLTASTSLPAALPKVLADPARVREIVLNLVDNAVKYTPAGGSVHIVAATVDGFVRIDVADTGVGIPSNAASRIFEPFYRVKGTRPQRGEASSGLGLALVKRMVEAHGGTVGFTSETGIGTTFSFTLPVITR